jgi:hypothetical protein
MKKNSQHIWLAILGVAAVGGAGIWAYEKFYAATTIAPGAVSMTTPSNGTVALALPSGAKGWTSAAVVSVAGATATAPAVPTAPTTHLQLSVQKGAVATILWVDSTGATQTSVISFN